APHLRPACHGRLASQRSKPLSAMMLRITQSLLRTSTPSALFPNHMTIPTLMTRRTSGSRRRSLSAPVLGTTLCALFVFGAGTLSAQNTVAPAAGTRPALEAQLRIQDSLGRAGVESAAAEAARIRQRLAEGDFRVGDRVVVIIQNSTDYPVEVIE